MIRYDKKLNQEIAKTVRNFNQKIARLEKLDNENIKTPEKVSVKDFKSGYTSRKDLRRKLNYLKMFSKRGSENVITTQGGFDISQYELAVAKKESSRVKRNLTREINKLSVSDVKIFGKSQGLTLAQMGDSRLTNLKRKREALNKNLLSLDNEEYNRYISLIERIDYNKEKTTIFKDNYIEMLLTNGYMAGYDSNKLNEIASKLLGLSDKEFLNVFNTDKSIQSILEYYNLNVMNMWDTNNSEIAELYDNLYNSIDSITNA